MSLATRCPACGTVFRVVRDQLKVSDGWVRCGRCSDVFNGAQRLFELEAAAPQERPADLVQPLAERDDATDLAMARVHIAPPPRSAETMPLSGTDTSPQDTAETPPETADMAAMPPPPPAELPESGATPEFIRRAERAERWRRPARRGLLAGVALLLAVLLFGQMALHYRDMVAAHWPATRPALQAACNLLQCRVEAPRHIDSLKVDSSGLVRMQDSPLYRLSLVVQNKASTIVRMPAFDLALTDIQGQTVVRRVFTAAELGQTVEQLPAGGELSLQATLDLGDRRIAGYTVELFYP
jgi:predicted Zn finger-like uncharacterized protein